MSQASGVVTIGVFDGVHRGHRHIFQQVIAKARQMKATPVVYTFDPHPARVVAPDSCPLMINTLAQRVALIREAGIQKVVVQKFDRAFSRKTPEDFFHEILVRRLKAKALFVGYDFTFGVRRSGTIDHLKRFCHEAGISLTVIGRFLSHQTLISSTQIRQDLSRGHVRQAADLLGRPYFMEGKVVRGRGIGGKTLGIHTANLQTDNDWVLPSGVYITSTRVGRKTYRSITNIGTNPTFGTNPLSIETHLMDLKTSILGRTLRIDFLEKLREEITFSSPQDLATQIQNDIRVAESHFKKRKAS